MKIKQLNVLSYIVLPSIVFSSVLIPYQAQALTEGRCKLALGEWSWDKRQFPAAILPNGMVAAVDFGKALTGTWKCLDSSKGHIRVNWETGHVNDLVIDSNGKSMEGTSIHPDSGSPGNFVLRVLRR